MRVGESPLFYCSSGTATANGPAQRNMKRGDILAAIENITRSVTDAAGLELFELELKGSGKNQLLRIMIDKPEGVTHGDCEHVSRSVSELLDAADPIPGAYQLEVSSPGIERPLRNPRDWDRFRGKKAQVVLKTPLADDPKGLKVLDGIISDVQDAPAPEQGSATLQLADGALVTIPLEQVSRANLKFEW